MHFGLGCFRELDRRDADSTGRGVNQHPLTGAQRSVAVQRRPGGRVIHRDRGTLFEAQRIGEHNRVGGRNVDDLAVATKSCTGQDSFADPVRVDPITDSLDRPSDFVSDHRRKFRRVWVQADAGEMVSEVHPCCADGDPQLARARWRRVRSLPHLQDRWVAMFGDDHCSHNVLLVRLDGLHPRTPLCDSTSYQEVRRGVTFAVVHFDWERLTDSVHRCRLPFCDVTVGLVRGRTGILLVDTGTTLGEATAIAADVKQIAGCQVTHVVLTHKHFDHVLGSSVFDQAEVFCAPEVVEYLRSATDRLREDALSYGADTAEVDRAIAALKPPQHGIYDAAVDLGDRTVTITHPGSGHTTADLVVVAPATGHADGPTVVFTGDLVEESADPDIDADSDLAAWPATLDRVLAIGGPDASYVPGHGKVVDAQFVRRQRAWLRTRASRQPRETPATLPCKR